MKIFVTGASGFIGKALCPALVQEGHEVVCALRFGRPGPTGVRHFYIPEIGSDTDWTGALDDIDVVVHLAGMAHKKTRHPHDLYHSFMRVNVAGTMNLARQAEQAGVKRFIFLSSIGVNGSSTTGRPPFTGSDDPAPHNAYALSKYRAEKALRELEAHTTMAVVILRPPLVYGPGVKANFLTLLHLVRTGLPLPLEAIQNKRSFIALPNLVSGLTACVQHPNAKGRTFTISDHDPISTPILIRCIADAMGKRVLLYPIPRTIVQKSCQILGKTHKFYQLWGDLCIDNMEIRDMLQWTPEILLKQGIQQTVTWYLNR